MRLPLDISTFPTALCMHMKDFRVIAAGNTIGRGATENITGRQALDFSTLDRFMAVEILYDERIDKVVANNDMDLVAFAQEFRKAAEENEIMILLVLSCSWKNCKVGRSSRNS